MRNIFFYAFFFAAAAMLFSGCTAGESTPANLSSADRFIAFDYTTQDYIDITLQCNKSGATWDFTAAEDPAKGNITQIDGAATSYPHSVTPAGNQLVVRYDRAGQYSTDTTDLITFTFTITATVDGSVQTVTPVISLDVNRPPTFTSPAPTFSNTTDFSGDMAAYISDPDNNSDTVLDIDFLHTTTGVGSVAQTAVDGTAFDFTATGTGTGYFNLRLHDGHMNGELVTDFVYIGINNTAPTVPSGALTYYSYPDRELDITLKGTDADGDSPLVFEYQSMSANGTMTEFNAATGVCTVTIGAAVTNVTFNYRVGDGVDFSAWKLVTIQVNDAFHFTDELIAGSGTSGHHTEWLPIAGGLRWIGLVDGSVSGWNGSHPPQRLPQEDGNYNGASAKNPPWEPFMVPYSTSVAGKSANLNEDGDEGPIRGVSLSGYSIMRTEMTNALFLEFLNDPSVPIDRGTTGAGSVELNADMGWNAYTGRSMCTVGYASTVTKYDNRIYLDTSTTPGVFKIAGENQEFLFHPVVNVSWYGAISFAEWLSDRDGSNSYDVPTEAEWECAARGGVGVSNPGYITWRGYRAHPWYLQSHWGEYRHGQWHTISMGSCSSWPSEDAFTEILLDYNGDPAVIAPGSLYVYTNGTPLTYGYADYEEGQVQANILDRADGEQLGTLSKVDYSTGQVWVSVTEQDGVDVYVQYFSYEPNTYDPLNRDAKPYYTKYCANFADIVKNGEENNDPWEWVFTDANPGDHPSYSVGTLPVASFWNWPYNHSAWDQPLTEPLFGPFYPQIISSNTCFDMIGNVWEICFEEYNPNYYQQLIDNAGGDVSGYFNDSPDFNNTHPTNPEWFWPDSDEGDDDWDKILPDTWNDFITIRGGDWKGSVDDFMTREWGHGQEDSDTTPDTNYFNTTYRGRTELWRINDRGGEAELKANEAKDNVGFRIIKRAADLRPPRP